MKDRDVDMKKFSNTVSEENMIWIELAQDWTNVGFLECGSNIKTYIRF